ncbi:hypothetical protein [Kocuria marina]|nr:hypothetical protein [Kocuria marina]MCT1616366.1 hypothetical protein [Kocuria marina]
MVHFVKEKSEVKEQFLEAMGSCGIQAVIYGSSELSVGAPVVRGSWG